MPLMSNAANVGGDLQQQTQDSINQVLTRMDSYVVRIAQNKRLVPSQVRLLRPCNLCAIVDDSNVHIVLTNINVGGLPIHRYIDLTDKHLDLQSAIFLVNRELAFEQPFGFSFSRGLLDVGEQKRDDTIKQMAEDYIQEEILNIERLNRIVRINPIFQGRDFIQNNSLAFVLLPLSEPFNTIFTDHIKPTVESIRDFTCIKADDIYDNRPIIEDIWRNINEARIVIAELTGKNPNVFYETGIAHTVGKEVIMITQNIKDVPFDLRHLRCIVYEYTPRGAHVLEENLLSTINNIISRANS